MELEESSFDYKPLRDPRKHMPELPPVWVEAVDDVQMYGIAGLEREMDGFYIELLKFERVPREFNQFTEKRASQFKGPAIIYRGENALVFFEIVETPPHREDFRPLQVMIPHYHDFLEEIEKQEIEFERQRGLTPGLERILLQDPSGNWVSVAHRRVIM